MNSDCFSVRSEMLATRFTPTLLMDEFNLGFA